VQEGVSFQRQREQFAESLNERAQRLNDGGAPLCDFGVSGG
jgi:hypothetical protein